MTALLEVKDLTIQVGKKTLVDHVRFQVLPGKCTAIVGESGSGKTLSCMSLLQLNPLQFEYPFGTLEFDEVITHNTAKLAPTDPQLISLRGKKIGMIFQDTLSSLNPAHKVGRQVAESLLQHFDISKDEARARVVELFRKLGIPDPERRYEAYPHEFSGGMRQRVMIAIATICEPDLVIADEPTTALDVTIQAQIMSLLKDLQKTAGKTFILITHNMALVSEVADHVAVMYLGRVVEYGTVEQVLRDPRHPYTKALMASVPNLEADKSVELQTVDGQTPSPAEVTVGCEFAGRCPYVVAACKEKTIEMTQVSTGHDVRCIRLDSNGKLPILTGGASNE